MQMDQRNPEVDHDERCPLEEVSPNRTRVRKHTVYINGKEKVAFLEKVAQSKLSQVKEPELIFLFKDETKAEADARS